MRYLAILLLLALFLAGVIVMTLVAGHSFYIVNKALNQIATELNKSGEAHVSSDYYVERSYGSWISIYNVVLFAALVILIVAIFIYTRRR